MSTSEFDKYKVDHLFLLIGENPLPNYVAAKTLLRKDGKCYLVFTEHTKKPAERLMQELGISEKELVRLDNNESNAYEIKDRIREKIKEIKSYFPDKKQFGLNYTGGTKAMAVHAYQALLHPDAKKPEIKLDPPPLFSYLDSRSLKMLIDQEKGHPIPIGDVKSKLEFSLEEVFNLHEPWSQKEPPISSPKLHELANKLAILHTDVHLARAWRWWCDNVLRANARNPKKPGEWLEETELKKLVIPLQSNVADKILLEFISNLISSVAQEKSLLEILQENEFEKIRHISKLSSSLWTSSDTSYIEKAVATIQLDLGISGTGLSLEEAAHKGQFKKIKHFCKWLDGEWLEHHVLQETKHIDCINDSRMSFHVKDDKNNDKFEFDVAFMRNYQLFALSCTTDTDPGMCKLKLFEAYRRARQMGGDEARIALVCCYDKPDKIKKGFMSYINDPKVNVFGCADIANISEKLLTWIKEVDA